MEIRPLILYRYSQFRIVDITSPSEGQSSMYTIRASELGQEEPSFVHLEFTVTVEEHEQYWSFLRPNMVVTLVESYSGGQLKVRCVREGQKDPWHP